MNVIRHLKQFLFLTGVLTLALLSACGEPEPLKVGFVGTLSGRRSEIGVAGRNGMQLMIDKINEAGGVNGRPIQIVVHDNEGEPDKCRKILNTMMDDGIQFILGPLFSQMAEATLETIEGRDVLVVSPTMSTDILTGKDDNLIRTASTTTRQAQQIADHTAKHGLKNIAVIYDLSNRKYTELLYNAFKIRGLDYGINVPKVLTIDKTGHPEMLPLAKEIIASGADGVLMCLAAVDAANLSQQLRKLGSDMQFIGVSWSQTDDLIQHGGKAIEGMLLVSTKNYAAPRQAYIDFRQAYYDRHQEYPSFAGGRGYDAMGILYLGMTNADSLTPSAVKQAILSIENYEGLSDNIALDEYGDSLSGYSMVTVKDGQFVSLD